MCGENPDPHKLQFVIAYDGWMEKSSRRHDFPHAGQTFPVLVDGFRRGWFSRGISSSLEATYLGTVPDFAHNSSRLNAVVFEVRANTLKHLDKSEGEYCRIRVLPQHVAVLLNSSDSTADLAKQEALRITKGDIWIYVSTRAHFHGRDLPHAPNSKFPIVQSYVDVFLAGCLEMEKKFKLAGFAKECIETTSYWSGNWINDRVLPRRPFIYEPLAWKIDRILEHNIPKFYKMIRVESAVMPTRTPDKNDKVLEINALETKLERAEAKIETCLTFECREKFDARITWLERELDFMKQQRLRTDHETFSIKYGQGSNGKYVYKKLLSREHHNERVQNFEHQQHNEPIEIKI